MKTKNRWLIALSAISIHISIGSIYAYSVFNNPLSEQFGWETTQVALTFTLAIFFLGISAAFFGKFVEKYGPRRSAIVAAILFAGGLLGAGIATTHGSLYGFYLTYGVISGMGLGIGYISPVSTLVAWFPDRRGLATGMAVMGFGAGALICSPIAAKLIVAVGIANTFYILGTAYFILMMAGALYIEKPEAGWAPHHMKATHSAETSQGGQQDLATLSAKEAVRTKRFWMLWVMMFVNISSGIMIISVASPMAQEKVGMTAAAAVSMVGIMGLFNGGGRIGWATVSDYMGRTNVFTTFFCLQLIAFLLMPHVTSPIAFQILIFLIISIYGGGFATLPAYIGDLFGTKELGEINGYLLTSWSIAGIVGPMIVAFVHDLTSSYDATFYVFAVLIGMALLTTIGIRLNIRKFVSKSAAKS